MPVDFTASSDAAVSRGCWQGCPHAAFHATDSHREAMMRRSDVAESVIRDLRVREEAGASARMRRKVARLGLDSRQMSFSVGCGPAAQETLRHALALGADLIVAGRQLRSRLDALLPVSVSSRVLSGSACDVLIVPQARDAAPPRTGDRRPTDTDWRQILGLYELLDPAAPGPVVTLNHIVAAAMVHGPRAGLELLTPLDRDPRLADHHRLAAVRGHLYEKANDPAAAIASYQAAADRTSSTPERNYLLFKAARLRERAH